MIALLLSLALAGGDAAGPVTPEALRALNAGVRSLTADVAQVKEGKYWARPLESRIRLAYTPGRVVWETVAPVASRVVIGEDGMTVVGPDGRVRDAGPVASDPRFAATVRFIRALFAVDLPAIERDFALEYGPRQVIARPRPGSEVQIFREIQLRFDERLELATVTLETASERTTLTFSHVERIR